ncbi:MAG: right-handed parallel beta-helix repeat-containing protein [Bacteroidales bacterium]|nr:right-handed parallel beta-helix repeat-containing protein [Candidatus Latescibacterota bacterium]
MKSRNNMYICPACRRKWLDENAAANGFVCYRSCDTPLVQTEEEAGAHLNYLDSVLLGSDSGIENIRDAVLAVKPGGIIEIPPGRYREPVIIDKPITLKKADGGGGEVFLETVSSPAIKVFSEDVVLNDISVFRGLDEGGFPLVDIHTGCLKMDGCRFDCRKGLGINIQEKAMFILTGSSISQPGDYGIKCERGASLTVSQTSINGVVAGQEGKQKNTELFKPRGTGIIGVAENALELSSLKISGFAIGLESSGSHGGIRKVDVDGCTRSINLEAPDHLSLDEIKLRGRSASHLEIIGGECSVSNSSFVGGIEQVIASKGKLLLSDSKMIDSGSVACRIEDCPGTEMIRCTIADGKGNGIQVSGDSGITLENNKIKDISGAGIIVIDGSASNIDDCKLDGCGVGIYVMSGARPTVSNTKIRDSRGSGILLQNSATGLYKDVEISDSGADQFVVGRVDEAVRLEACKFFRGNAAGIRVVDGGTADIINCIVDGPGGNGLILGKGSKAKLKSTAARNCRESGILAGPLSEIILQGIIMEKNYRCGMWAVGVRELEINESTILGNGLCGIYMDEVESVSFKENEINNNMGPGVTLVGKQDEGKPGAVSIRGTKFENNHLEGILGIGHLDMSVQTGGFKGNLGPGIKVFGGVSIDLSDCKFSDNRKKAVRIGMWSNAGFSRCSFTDSGRSISLARQSKTKIIDNKTKLPWVWKTLAKLSGRLIS